MPNVSRKCANKKCGATFTARSADVARGWARFCSKSCKATVQERRTHQHRDYLHRSNHTEYDSIRSEETFNDAHLFSNEEHDCNKGDFNA